MFSHFRVLASRRHVLRSPRAPTRRLGKLSPKPIPERDDTQGSLAERQYPEHAVISTFDLFSIGGTNRVVSPLRPPDFSC